MFQVINYYFISNLIHTQLVSLQNGTKKKPKVYESSSNKKKIQKVALSSATFEGRANDYYIFVNTNTNLYI